ncbi:hypothetical protein AAFF_G00405390 [Aldrovandia affinis]|uniref:Uncharacterized protein n=1 Tax=Aldrovandia affinis TaxID=143900 RepID=A0AAD7WKX4_9TELE|nr:hypothetical protein AAFF_G00405390 [Aldrovandia affinis]
MCSAYGSCLGGAPRPPASMFALEYLHRARQVGRARPVYTGRPGSSDLQNTANIARDCPPAGLHSPATVCCPRWGSLSSPLLSGDPTSCPKGPHPSCLHTTPIRLPSPLQQRRAPIHRALLSRAFNAEIPLPPHTASAAEYRHFSFHLKP